MRFPLVLATLALSLLTEWNSTSVPSSTRVACVMLSRNTEIDRMRAIHEVWTHRCHAEIFVLNHEDPQLDAAVREFGGTPFFTGVSDSYELLWARMVHAWKRLAEVSDADIFFKVDLDTFVDYDRFEVMLGHGLIDRERFIGYPIVVGVNGEEVVFNSGGAGYVLSRATVEAFADADLAHWTAQRGGEDVFVVSLARALGIDLKPNLDQVFDENGCAYFVPLGPDEMTTMGPHAWMYTHIPVGCRCPPHLCKADDYVTHHRVDLSRMQATCGSDTACHHRVIVEQYAEVAHLKA